MADPKVEYNFQGRSGLKVSNICLGTMTFGVDSKHPLHVPTQSNEETAHNIMDRFAEHGGNFLDTSNIYVAGKSESIIGNWLSKKDRERFVIATKVYFPTDLTNPNAIGLSRRHIVESIDRSLERLQTHYIDLYQVRVLNMDKAKDHLKCTPHSNGQMDYLNPVSGIQATGSLYFVYTLQSHSWDPGTPLDETLRTFDDLIRCGKVRYYGASNFCGWQLQKMVCRMEAMGLNRCVSLQQQYSLLVRQSEFEAFMVCREEGIGVLPWSPLMGYYGTTWASLAMDLASLKGGLLTGKFKKEEKLDGSKSRLGYVNKRGVMPVDIAPAWSKYKDDEKYWKLVDEMGKIAANHGKSVPQVALRWLLQKDFVPSVIIGATSVAQLEDNMGAGTGWKMTEEEMALLDDITPRDAPYPYNMLWGVNPFQPKLRENKFIPSTLERFKTGQ